MGYSMRLKLTRVCSLNGFQLVMGLYRRGGGEFLLIDSALKAFSYKKLFGEKQKKKRFISKDIFFLSFQW